MNKIQEHLATIFKGPKLRYFNLKSTLFLLFLFCGGSIFSQTLNINVNNLLVYYPNAEVTIENTLGSKKNKVFQKIIFDSIGLIKSRKIEKHKDGKVIKTEEQFYPLLYYKLLFRQFPELDHPRQNCYASFNYTKYFDYYFDSLPELKLLPDGQFPSTMNTNRYVFEDFVNSSYTGFFNEKRVDLVMTEFSYHNKFYDNMKMVGPEFWESALISDSIVNENSYPNSQYYTSRYWFVSSKSVTIDGKTEHTFQVLAYDQSINSNYKNWKYNCYALELKPYLKNHTSNYEGFESTMKYIFDPNLRMDQDSAITYSIYSDNSSPGCRLYFGNLNQYNQLSVYKIFIQSDYIELGSKNSSIYLNLIDTKYLKGKEIKRFSKKEYNTIDTGIHYYKMKVNLTKFDKGHITIKIPNSAKLNIHSNILNTKILDNLYFTIISETN